MHCSVPAGGLLAGLTGLASLDLSRTQQRQFPDDLLLLPRLRVLKLADNAIPTIPDGVMALSQLEELDLTNNDLSVLPYCLGLMGPTLRSLMLEGNPLRTIRRAILERGTPALLEYLRDKIPK